MSRRSYRGNSVATVLSTGISAVDTTATVTDGSGLPVGTNPFVITVNINKTGEEKILVSGRSGNTLSGLTRGYDGTTAATHQPGESVIHTLSAVDLDEANAHVNSTTGAHGFPDSATLVTLAGTQTLTNKTLTQAQTHASPDTDTATTSLHHTIGTGATQAAAGNHTHGSAGGSNPPEIAHPNCLQAIAFASGVNNILYVRIRPAANLTVTNIYAFGGTGSCEVGIYTNSGSGATATPASKLVSATGTTASGWTAIAVSSTALTAGTDYWLAVNSLSGNLIINSNGISAPGVCLAQASGTLPGTPSSLTATSFWPLLKLVA